MSLRFFVYPFALQAAKAAEKQRTHTLARMDNSMANATVDGAPIVKEISSSKRKGSNGAGPSPGHGMPKRKWEYVIIGTGTTASAAIESILNVQPDADILLLTDEVAELHPQVHAPLL